ncbi:MAG: phosphoribosylglycinamide formyltransferase [Myxococcota bacterium]
MKEVRVAVLASGSGSNLQALLDADLSPGRVTLVLSNLPDARALQRARDRGITTAVVDHRQVKPRRVFDETVVDHLRRAEVEWVVFAGFMRIVTEVLLGAFPSRIVNIHPSLLPAFPGLDAQRQAFEAGVKLAGCTVHLVDSGVDTGPILAQAAVPVLPEDDVESLRLRILEREHALLPAVVRALCSGQLRRQGAQAWLEGATTALSSLSAGVGGAPKGTEGSVDPA